MKYISKNFKTLRQTVFTISVNMPGHTENVLYR